ncbi:uncharacterized protein BDW43DRAFT_306620 [Aspergillus alliaceus]|uniref:uncharacterized protein n=1 Tax=Petromyces alliaceus TaxID=209559 RepID=UPI0012A646A6|nr:uncharacterized protein BDW43DRAFT_306620 [Aspergillus alliaceus]KAB8237919.1 hypothetical protein BDW43DRAFT_306620 [Aspergillus alliaceus]
MLDGPEGSIDNGFATSQTVVRQSRKVAQVKRSILTTNRTALDTVFEHAEETFHVYCHYPAGSKECERIFVDGVEDTIISLPDNIGDGPFGCIVYMRPVGDGFQMPQHHLEHRSLEGIRNPVYEIRVDYTNLLCYWDQITDSPVSRVKRGLDKQELTQEEWRARVQRAIVHDNQVRKRDESIQVKMPMEYSSPHINKCWWGAFRDWLKKLPWCHTPGFHHTINLIRARWGCPGQTFSADLQMGLEANIAMDARYAYYLSVTFIPPGKPETFAYFGMEPTAYLGLHIEGNAQMQTTTGRKKIIDTLSYPGLAVKGTAAIGPTLGIRGKITLHGQVDAGVTLSFGKAERTKGPAPGTVKPVFEAGAIVDAQLDILVTPEANIGLKIGGGTLVGSATLMDAQLTGYVTGDLSFQAHSDYDTTINTYKYRFGSYLFYNLRYKATAKILNFVDWALGPRMAYSPDKTVKLYEKQGSIPLANSRKNRRSVPNDVSTGLINTSAHVLINNSMSAYLDPATELFRRKYPMDTGE